MSYIIHYRFKCMPQRFTLRFADTVVSVADVKLSIVNQHNLRTAEAINLIISNESTNEVFEDETEVLSKHGIVIVRRVPMRVPKGVLAHTQESNFFKFAPTGALSGSTEAQRLAAVVAEAQVTCDVRGAYAYVGYICHRCNVPGHWIGDCPAPIVRKPRAPTGIPREKLKIIKDEEAGMQDQSGRYVTIAPDEDEFARLTCGLRTRPEDTVKSSILTHGITHNGGISIRRAKNGEVHHNSICDTKPFSSDI